MPEKNGTLSKLRLILAVLLPMIALTLWLGNTHWMAEANKTELLKQDADYTIMEKRDDRQDEDIKELRNDIKYIVKAVDRIEKKL